MCYYASISLRYVSELASSANKWTIHGLEAKLRLQAYLTYGTHAAK